LMRRELRFRALARIEVAASLTGLALVAGFAVGGYGVLALIAGQLGVASIRASLEERGRLVSNDRWAADVVFWNMRRPPLDEVRVRLALAKAVNRGETIDALLAGEGRPAASWFPPGFDGHNASLQPLAHDPEGAVALLVEAGFSRSSDDNSWSRDGVPLEIEMMHPASDVAASFAAAIQADLAEIGVRIDLRPVKGSTLRERIRQRNFEAILLGYTLSLTPDKSIRLWHSREAAEGRNYTGLEDASIDTWYEEAAEELDDERRTALYEKIDRRLSELQPAMFLWNPKQTYAVAHRVRDFKTSVRGPHAFHPGQRAWWIVEARDSISP